MKREWTTRVGADGVLALRAPLGRDGANKTVRVVVESVEDAAAGPAPGPAAWQDFVRGLAGRISDPTFDRHRQGEYELRDALP